MSDLLNELKKVKDFEFLACIGDDRHLFRVPVSAVEEHEDFQRLRGKAIEQVDLLQASMKRAGTSLYPVCVYAERDAARAIRLFVVDGHQRLRAEKQNGSQLMVIQYISRWRNLTDAFAEGIDLNYARYEVGEEDLVTILQTGKLTVAEVASHSGFGETTVRDYAKIAGYPWACDLLKAKGLGRVRLGKLLDACNNNSGKLDALSNSLVEKLEQAKAAAEEVKARIKSDKQRTYNHKFVQRADVGFYFKNEAWDAWVQALKEDPVPVEIRDGKRFLKVEGGGGKAASPFIGGSSDWEREVAIYDFAGRKIGDILTEDFEEIRSRWDEIGEYLDAIIRRRRQAEAKADIPQPPSGPVEDRPSEAPPIEQVPRAKVGRRAKAKEK
jgi:ParB-like chromosome segregation protein Spo0J